MFVNPSNFTFSKFLGGAYKTLTLANQIIPLYQQVSPMVKNARNAFSIIKGVNKSNNFVKKNKSVNSETKIQKKELSLNNPVFFQ